MKTLRLLRRTEKTCNPEFFIKCDFHDSLRGAETHDFAK